ncbi:MAG: tetratricopeptide repeat protein [Aggregatilineales bacterium]
MTNSEEWLWVSLHSALLMITVSEGVAILNVLTPTYGFQSAIVITSGYFLIVVALLTSIGKSALSFPFYWAQSALSKANYSEALRRAQYLGNKLSSAYRYWSMYNCGNILLFSGQYAEAEKSFIQSLQKWLYSHTTNPFLVQTLTDLGYVFLHQGRYPEATRAFQGALKLDPKAGHAIAGLAEIYLFQRIQPQKALDLVIGFLHNYMLSRVADRTIWGAILGDEAWAFAMLGQQAKAEASLEDAFQRMDRSFKPGMAGLHYRAGQVYKRNKRARVVKDFERAIELDPEGSWGQLARQALQELGSTPQPSIALND